LVRLIGEFEALERQWLEQGFEPVGKSWLDKAYKRGKKITIKQENKVKEGVFDGIDRNGGLLLRTAQGLETILVGDVFEVKEKND
jgi:BirA family biotin operon repressor/biotin-[acetyl-CoA-carboxylase] ligase